MKINRYQFFVPGKPVPQGSKSATVRNGRAIMFEANKNTSIWRHTVKTAIEAYFEAIGHKVVPSIDQTKAVIVHVVFVFARPKSNKTSDMIQKPDIDKLLRAILDACTESGMLHDDAQVDEIKARKRWANEKLQEKEGAWVTLTWWD